MMTSTDLPDWSPKVATDRKILVAGATGGIGRSLVKMLSANNPGIEIGVHGRNDGRIIKGEGHIPLIQPLSSDADCRKLVDQFCGQTGRIDGLVILVGANAKPVHWTELSEHDWNSDLNANLSMSFFLARAVFLRMREQGAGGRIIMTGTESALHGGGSTSFAYGAAKRATECIVQGMARDGAPYGILVNGVRIGFVDSGFHERWQGKTAEQVQERTEMVPLKRAGSPEEVAALICYLLGDWSQFITGQMIPITGGDWL